MEIPSAVMEQMASDDKPGYVLAVMLLSLATLIFCLVELIWKGRKEKITWRWPWFYYPSPPSNRPFGKLTEIIGLACSMAQIIVSVINYSFCLKDHNTPIKISVWPAIFSFGIVCCRFMTDPDDDDDDQEGAESRASSADVGLDQAIPVPFI